MCFVQSVDLILHAGDLAYADGFAPRWDSYGRMGQKLWANTITSYTGGNHEFSNSGENWANYKARYPNDFELAGSDSFLWYSYDAAVRSIASLVPLAHGRRRFELSFCYFTLHRQFTSSAFAPTRGSMRSPCSTNG